MISTDQGMSFSPPERCHAMPDPDKEGSMVLDGTYPAAAVWLDYEYMYQATAVWLDYE